MAKVSLVKGGKKVNGKFVANTPSKSAPKQTSTKTSSSSNVSSAMASQLQQAEKAIAGVASSRNLKWDPNTKSYQSTITGPAKIRNDAYALALAGKPINLPKPTPPTDASDVAQYDAVKGATGEPSVTSPVSGLASAQSLQALLDFNQKRLEEDQKRADAMAKENRSLAEKTLGTMKNPENVYDKTWKDTGINTREYFANQEAGIKEIDTLNQEYATVQAAMEQQIAQSNDKMASMNFINNQTAQIRRNAEPQLNTISAKINSKAATLQALQGNFAEARSLVRDAVDAAVAGNKYKYDMYRALYDQNVDNFNRVDSTYKESYRNAMNIALKAYEMQRDEKMQIGELLLTNPQAGITMSDSLDEAYDKIGISPMSPERRLLEAQIANTWANATDSTSGGGGGIADSSETAGDGGRLSELFNLVVGSSGSVDQTKRNISQFNKYLESGNVRAAQEMVNSLAIKNMTAEQKNRFTGFGIINDVLSDVSSLEQNFANTNPGIYRTLLENTKPWVQLSTDPRWQAYVSEVQGAINAYRNEIFGASLTGNELKAAGISLPVWEKDNYQTIISKLGAMQRYGNNVRESLIKNTTGQYSSSALNQPVSAPSVVQSTSAYDEATGQSTSGGWFSRFLNWLR